MTQTINGANSIPSVDSAKIGMGEMHAVGWDEDKWRDRFDEMSTSASKNCGLVYEIFCDRFSAMVDAEVEGIPEKERERAIQLALEWGYATASARDESEDVPGFCTHGFPDNCCPLGCDDSEEGVDESRDAGWDSEFDRLAMKCWPTEEAKANAVVAVSVDTGTGVEPRRSVTPLEAACGSSGCVKSTPSERLQSGGTSLGQRIIDAVRRLVM